MEKTEPEKKYLKLKRSKLYKIIKNDLEKQLEVDGVLTEFYMDLLLDYMDLWCTKTLLQEDIKLRGVSVTYDNGGGQKGTKKNDSVDQLLKVNAQMLKILADIGIKPGTSISDDEL